MPECSRCGRAEADGATLRETADGPLCVVCVDFWERHPDEVRAVDQETLGEYVDT